MNLTRWFGLLALLALLLGSGIPPAAAQREGIPPAPDRGPEEGEGPFERLILRGAVVVDGSGAPPLGPVDIVIEGNRIREVRSVGAPKLAIKPERRPQDATREIDASGMYVLPGLVDLHGHIGASGTETAEYVFKLWLAHGVTTVREPGCGNGVEWTLRARERSAANEIVAPRIFAYCVPGSGWDQKIDSPASAREYVRWASRKKLDGFKIFSSGALADPEIVAAILDEARKLGLGSTAHLAQLGVAQMNALDAARLGLRSMEHWYGLPEALFAGRRIQNYPLEYNYSDEQHRFAEAGRLWRQAAEPGTERWNQVIDELLALDFTLDPTFNIYEASRDLMRARRAEWHDLYTLPGVWRFYQPSRESHGSYWFDWTTADEIAWKDNYRLWMRFVNDYKNRGGRVTTGSDSGFIYQLFGFGLIRELELLQEAGFHPLEVIRSATLHGGEVLYGPRNQKPEIGLVRPGYLADLLLVDENPLRNFKVLYGTGAIRLDDETGEVRRVGGVRLVIKDGIVYDAKRLLQDVAEIVEQAREQERVAAGDAPELAQE